MSLLAIGWEPELRGLLTVIIGVVVLMGSVYMIMATNMGSRLAFLVTIAGLAGWMMLMGMTWWIYGIGLRGPDPSWAAVPGQTVSAGSCRRCAPPACSTCSPTCPTTRHRLDARNRRRTVPRRGLGALEPSNPAFGQAQAAATEFLVEEEAFAAGSSRSSTCSTPAASGIR